MVLYWFVCRCIRHCRVRRCRCCRRPQTFFCSRDNSEQLFGFISFLDGLMALTWRLPDYNFRCDLDLQFSRSNMEFALSQPKMVRSLWNEKQTYRLNSRPQIWPLGLTLTLTLTFQGQIWIYYISAKNGLIAMKRKVDWTIGLKCDHWADLDMLSAILPLIEENPQVISGFPSGRARYAELWYLLMIVSLKNMLRKQLNWQWFEMPWCSCNVTAIKGNFHLYKTIHTIANVTLICC